MKISSYKCCGTPGFDTIEPWIASVWELADSTQCGAELLTQQGFTHQFGIRHTSGFQYVRFTPEAIDPFYGYWQPAPSQPAPLLIHLPGYGAEMSAHPDLVALGYNVLHISPMGYSTPEGANEAKMKEGNWPVLPDTIRSGGVGGYREWLAQCLMAIRWALGQPAVLPDRISFFGTSQGGGAALLLASLFQGKGVRCVAADLPYLTNFRLANGRGAYHLAQQTLDGLAKEELEAAWQTLGLIDTLSHASRLTLPVLLTGGTADDICPPETIESLFSQLPSTRSFTVLEGVGHRYTTQFIPLAAAWFRLFA